MAIDHRRTVKTKMLSRWQVFGLADIQHACLGTLQHACLGTLQHACLGTLLSTSHRFPTLSSQCLLMAVVSAYRCGAVPDFHRVPSSCLQSLEGNQQPRPMYLASPQEARTSRGSVIVGDATPRGKIAPLQFLPGGDRRELLYTSPARRSMPALTRDGGAIRSTQTAKKAALFALAGSGSGAGIS
jgi:hypothetical protein